MRLFHAPLLQPVTSRCGPEAHPYEVVDFFAFRDVLFGRVSVEHAPGDPPRVSVLLPGGRWLPAVDRLDRFHASTNVRTSLTFSAALPPDMTGDEIEHIVLYLHFCGEHLEIAAPSWVPLQQDGFVRSEAAYWPYIRALPPGSRVLEIGSRARSGIVRRNLFPSTLKYVGLDIVAGPNVDVVGDAHHLSEYFPAAHFDAAFSVSVWEHLAMPWKVSLELNRVLKTGAIAMINTHQSWPSHEEPWDYFRFSEHACPALFNAATGFEILACGMGMPAVMAPALAIKSLHDQSLEWQYAYLATCCVVRKVGSTTLEWPVDLNTVARGSYPHH